MKLAVPRYLFVLLVLLMTMALFLYMAEAQRSRGNRRRNPNRRRGGARNNRGRGRTRGRNGGRTTMTTTSSESTEGCEEIHLPMCKGLVPYTHTRLPNKFNHTTQAEVYGDLEHLWAYMDHYCSSNARVLICSLYLPKCVAGSQPQEPCRRTCMTVKRKCAQSFRESFGLSSWSSKFSCRGLPRRQCMGTVRETRCRRQYPTCLNNTAIATCAGLSFTYGTLPNMFYQCHVQEINTELEYFNTLRETNCHADLNFLLCGVYSPFCIRAEIYFTFPCREICEEVRAACEAHYTRLYHGLPWPNKLQCHRYPSTVSPGGQRCVMPNEGTTFLASSGRK